MLTQEAIVQALQDQEAGLAALVDRVDAISGLLDGVIHRLADTVQAVTCPVHGSVHMIPWVEL